MDDYWSTPSSTSFTYPRQTARRYNIYEPLPALSIFSKTPRISMANISTSNNIKTTQMQRQVWPQSLLSRQRHPWATRRCVHRIIGVDCVRVAGLLLEPQFVNFLYIALCDVRADITHTPRRCLGCFVRRKRRKVMETDTSPSAVEVDQPPPAYTPREPNSDTGQAQQSNMEMQRPANVYRSGTSW
ncbi:predicted protein [Histoplasma capsulatum var. duboisii H88]|uniref:Predicted protein n=2 Tax=Ajellomyces capsulatus TaxID=5037 RepID=F0UR23_AJEC8|nr:predicted protein [Histoplasma capsulatum H143]EGC48350.1 predicted protein [Histoplasma capsulatum var. duboisii H88]